jgi:uncharacterized membrane protein required for colicin V production
MTIYDGVMLGLVVVGMVWGAWKGLTWQLASVASLVLGYLVAYPTAGKIAPSFPGNPTVAWLLALITAYVLISGSVFLAAWGVRMLLRRMKFEAYDRHLGMLTGGVSAAALGMVGTVLVVSLAPQTREPILTSPSGRVVNRTLAVAREVLPHSVRDVLQPFWEGNLAPSGSYDPEIRRAVGERVTSWTITADDVEPPTTGRETGVEFPGDDDGDSILSGILEQGGARIGRALSEAVESKAGGKNGRAIERR